MKVRCKEWNLLTEVGKIYTVIDVIKNEFGDKFYKLKEVKYGQVATWCFDVLNE